jgi:hypothetical protein
MLPSLLGMAPWSSCLVARDAADSPAFGQHAAGDGASETAGGAADYDEFGHGC